MARGEERRYILMDKKAPTLFLTGPGNWYLKTRPPALERMREDTEKSERFSFFTWQFVN
jgi:hypothetical protein